MRPVKLDVAQLLKYTGIFFKLTIKLLAGVRIDIVKLFVKQVHSVRVELNT